MTDESIYNEGGQIKDSAVAQKIANLEKPARDREIELQRQAKEGLSERGKDNLTIMKGVEEKYPDAVELGIDDEGRKVLFVPSLHELGRFGSVSIFFTQEGVVTLDTDGSIEEFDLTGITNFIIEKGDEFGKGGAFGNTEYPLKDRVLRSGLALRHGGDSVRVSKLDLANSSAERSNLSRFLQRSQELGLKRKQEGDTQLGPQDILADL